jgi:hypothetical protein
MPPAWQGLLWGILPFGSSLLAILVLFLPGTKNPEDEEAESTVESDENVLQGRLVS